MQVQRMAATVYLCSKPIIKFRFMIQYKQVGAVSVTRAPHWRPLRRLGSLAEPPHIIHPVVRMVRV